MNYGLYVPNIGSFADADALVEIARRADANGWDGVFVWDMITPVIVGPGQPPDAVDPWIVLAGMAVATERIRLGPLVTPLARRRPQKVARETVTLDRLSGGRVILGVGLGDSAQSEFAAFGDDDDPRVRAARLDEALEVLLGLWSGEPTSHRGEHFVVEETTFRPRAVQSPRIPIWTAGAWPRKRPARRAARFDGMFPIWTSLTPVDYGDQHEYLDRIRMLPEHFRDLSAYIAEQRESSGPFDLVLNAKPGTPAPEAVREYAASGVTWWLEMFLASDGIEAALERASSSPGPVTDDGRTETSR